MAVVFGVLFPCAGLDAEVLIRWDRDDIPASSALGLSTVVIPADNRTAIRNATAQGYRVYLELEAQAVAKFVPPSRVIGVVVKGPASAAQLAALERRMESRGIRVLVLDERGKWPHIRSNWVTRNNDVLQVARRSAQPWIENNAALFSILRATHTGAPRLLTYRWTPITLAAIDEGPGLENYLVAIAEAGSFGGGLLLPLHERFQTDLLLGKPAARAEWAEIRRHLDFHGWSLADRYRPLTTIGVVTADPMFSFEVMNLLLRHNLPFDLIGPSGLPRADLSSLDLLIVLDQPTGSAPAIMMDFARNGGTVIVADKGSEMRPGETPGPWAGLQALATSDDRVTYEAGAGRVIEMRQPIADPDRFALDVRQILGAGRRVIDIWNGITVLATVLEAPGGETRLVTALNYAHQPLPVQLRVRGTFPLVHYESPDEPLTLLPHTHRDGYTEFVLPALRTGARVFLSGTTGDGR